MNRARGPVSPAGRAENRQHAADSSTARKGILRMSKLKPYLPIIVIVVAIVAIVFRVPKSARLSPALPDPR